VKLVRSFIDSPKAVATIPESVVYTLIAVAENVEDKLRNICLETLCELGM
jgi:hypothetical protein